MILMIKDIVCNIFSGIDVQNNCEYFNRYDS